MKKIFTLIGAALLVASASKAQNTLYPGITENRTYQAPKATAALIIDGNGNDASWALAPWKTAFSIAPTDWLSTETPNSIEGAFSGLSDINVQYKIIWDLESYYMLIRYQDDNIIYADNHNGYRNGSVPSYSTVTSGASGTPALGGGDGTAYQAFRMDMIQTWITPYTPEILANAGITLAAGAVATTFNRANNALLYNFFPGQITKAVKPEAVLWSPKHNTAEITPRTNPRTYQPQTHQAIVAGRFVAEENAYYIEFKDATWTTLFSTIFAKLSGQKDYTVNVPAIGDKFLLQGEINDADGSTNRRDYINYWTHMSANATKNAANDMSESLIVELVNVVTGLKNPKATNSLEIYPNVTAGNTINLSRAADVQFFNLSGHMMLESKNATIINISNLKKGVYMVKDSHGNVNKLVRN